jgi:hypothetical protein
MAAGYPGSVTPGDPVGILRWDGSSWLPAQGAGWDILEFNSLHVFNDRLFAGGFFSMDGFPSLDNVAAWNGTSWSVLGSGTDHVVLSLNHQGGDLLVGGGFSVAGGKGSAGIAIWEEYPTDVLVQDLRTHWMDDAVTLSWNLHSSDGEDVLGVDVQRAMSQEGPYQVRALSLSPEPAMQFTDADVVSSETWWYRLVVYFGSGRTEVVGPVVVPRLVGDGRDERPTLQLAHTQEGLELHYQVPVGPSPVRLDVFDVRGRRVVALEDAVQAPGMYVRYLRPQSIPSGVFFALLRVGARSVSVKFTTIE